MPKLVWDQTSERLYETGVDHGVLFVQKPDGTYNTGVAWNGLTAVTESPSGGDENKIYADNINYVSLRATEDFGATIEAYTYPDEWGVCDGSAEPAEGVFIGQQKRNAFGFVYRTRIGNDTEMDAHGYKLHLVYNATASPSEKNYQTVNDSPEAITFSWEVTTTPVPVEGYRPTAQITIDSTKVDAAKLKTFEETIFGSENGESTLPSPELVIKAFKTTTEGGGGKAEG